MTPFDNRIKVSCVPVLWLNSGATFEGRGQKARNIKENRTKERFKYGLKAARRAPQFSKRWFLFPPCKTSVYTLRSAHGGRNLPFNLWNGSLSMGFVSANLSNYKFHPWLFLTTGFLFPPCKASVYTLRSAHGGRNLFLISGNGSLSMGFVSASLLHYKNTTFISFEATVFYFCYDIIL